MAQFMKPGDPLRQAAHRLQAPTNVRQQRGIALAVALMLLVVITLIGLAAVRTTTMQQRMTANFYDREIAFQNAEAALEAGAKALPTSAAVIARNCGQGGDICQANPFEDPGLDTSTIQTVTTGDFTVGANAAGQPQYVIENMGTYADPSSSVGYTQTANSAQYGAQGVTTTAIYYRITARSGDPAVIGDRAVVLLQAMYKQ